MRIVSIKRRSLGGIGRSRTKATELVLYTYQYLCYILDSTVMTCPQPINKAALPYVAKDSSLHDHRCGNVEENGRC
jgi:hypothetical protein